MALIATNDNINNNFDKLFNKGIKSFGYENVVNIISSFYNKYELPIISMGSGTGVIEFLAKKNNNNINWICVDNDKSMNFPSSANQYINKPLMNIDYESCEHLIESTPSIVNNCILFLNWCLPNDSTYDFEAIIKLKPIAVLSIYEIFEDGYGAAGGEMFYNWTKNNTDYHHKEEYQLYANEEHLYANDDYELPDIRISWWQLNTLSNVDDLIVKKLPALYNEPMTQCSIS
jgi:hypothetical protein